MRTVTTLLTNGPARFVPSVMLLLATLLTTQPLFADNSASAKNLRVVSLSPSNTEILFAIGAGSEVVGVTANDDYPAAVRSLPKVGGFDDVSIERVVSLHPGLVLASNIHISRVVPALRRLGLRVEVVDPQTVDEVFDAIRAVGRAVGRSDEAAALASRLESQVNAISRRVADLPRPKVYWELSPDLWTAGPGSYIDDLIRLAGGRNVAKGASAPWTQISSETVVASDPRFIILSDAAYGASPSSVGARPGWRTIDAVRNGRIIPVANEDVVSRPGPRVVEALAWLAGVLHPDSH